MIRGIIYCIYIFIACIIFFLELFIQNNDKTLYETIIYISFGILAAVLLLGLLIKNKNIIKISLSFFSIYYIAAAVFIILFHRDLILIGFIACSIHLVWLYFIFKGIKSNT